MMGEVCWLIDADMFDGYRNELVAEIRRLDHRVKEVHPPKPGYSWDDEGCSYRETFPADACVVVHGDIDLVTRVVREKRWTPGAFGSVENFRCSSYFCHFGPFLLNSDYVMLPFGELSRCRDFLLETLGKDGRIFVRPDSPLKLFAGQMATKDSFDADLELMGFYDFPQSEIVVVSSPKSIIREWRFVVADGEVVTGSRYSEHGKHDPQPEYSNEAHCLASRIAATKYPPDPVWVLDICETADGNHFLLEIGGFGFADLYACDKRKVAAAVSNVAHRVWAESTA